MSSARTACLVVAAGAGARLRAGRPKAFVVVAGHSLLDHAVDRATASSVVDVMVLVVPADLVGAVARARPRAVVVAGGATRQESVAAGLRVLDDDVDVVLVHDAARALTPPAVFGAVAAAVRSGHAAVVPAVPLHDTVRAVAPRPRGGEDGAGERSTLLDRSTLRAVQTPQGFARAVLDEAHRLAPGSSSDATDDATLVERLGHAVHLVVGSAESFKVTGPLDLLLAAALAASSTTTADGSRAGAPR